VATKKEISDEIYSCVVSDIMTVTDIDMYTARLIGNFVSDQNACPNCGLHQWCSSCVPLSLVLEDIQAEDAYFTL